MMTTDLRLASTIKLYNPPPVETRFCNPRPKSIEKSMYEMVKSLKSGWRI